MMNDYGKETIQQLATDFHNRFVDMTLEETQNILGAAKNLDTTKCWYVKKLLKDAIIEVAESRIKFLNDIDQG